MRTARGVGYIFCIRSSMKDGATRVPCNADTIGWDGYQLA